MRGASGYPAQGEEDNHGGGGENEHFLKGTKPPSPSSQFPPTNNFSYDCGGDEWEEGNGCGGVVYQAPHHGRRDDDPHFDQKQSFSLNNNNDDDMEGEDSSGGK